MEQVVSQPDSSDDQVEVEPSVAPSHLLCSASRGLPPSQVVWLVTHMTTWPHSAHSLRVDTIAYHLRCLCTLKVTGSQQVSINLLTWTHHSDGFLATLSMWSFL